MNGPPTVKLSKHDGDEQSGVPGAPVAVPPSVTVVDSLGGARSGIAVRFAVTSGGGTITGADAVSDASGVARVGSWTLGRSAAVNSLSATTATGSPVLFVATAERRSPNISLTLEKPSAADPAFVGDTVQLTARTTSTYEVASVIVAMAGRIAMLEATEPGLWQGTLLLTGTARDTATLLATATDIQGATTDVVRLLTHDRRPRVILTVPLDNAVAHAGLAIDAACDDDDPNGCTITVLRDPNLLAGPAPSPLKTTIALDALDGTPVPITILAVDSRGQGASASGTVLVEASPQLRLIGMGGRTDVPERAWDVRDTRLLLEGVLPHLGFATRSIKSIRHLDTVVSDSLPVAVEGVMSAGYLTPTGAVFRTFGPVRGAPDRLLHIWRNGALTSPIDRSAVGLAASGDFVVYEGFVESSIADVSVYRLNVQTGVEERVADAVPIDTELDVARNGDVVYRGLNGVARYRDGVNSLIAPDGPTSFNTSPVTDGGNVVFQRRSSGSAVIELWLFDGTSLSSLSALSSAAAQVTRSDYAVNAGWTAFSKNDASIVRQVWTRSPAGVQRVVSTFGSSAAIEAVAPDGSVVFTSADVRYFARPSEPPVRIGKAWGTALWRDGRFVVLLGNAAFAVEP
ncbi:MAG: hypothetical protein ACJ79A_10565 [Gemmatimonadaceae bacterium]